MQIGVLALQGDFSLHLSLLAKMGVPASPVKTPEELGGVDALIIPGGESTTIGMLMERFGLPAALRGETGNDAGVTRPGRRLPVFGTCAGAILLATDIRGSDQIRLGLMPMTVERNAYGRQIESFEVAVDDLSGALAGGASASGSGSNPAAPVEGVFIRAPIIRAWDPEVAVLARYEGNPVVVQYGPYLAATFHPELAGESRLHQHFTNMVAGYVASGDRAP
jgi:5'-phosphate synthase pdxT subunit